MNNLLGRKITLGSLVKFTLPSMIMMLVMSLYTVIDGTFISNLVGTDAFSAVNIAYPLLGVTIGIGTMFGTGLTAIVSRKLGEGKAKEARENFTFVTIVAVVLGGIMTGLSIIFLEDIVRLLGASSEILGYCKDYTFPLLFFFVPNILQIIFQSIFVANGKPVMGLVVTVVGGLVNVALDYVFIAVFDMGIAGAAWATGIGYTIPAVLGILYFFFNRKGNVYFVLPKVCWRVLLNAITNGSSEMVSCLSTSVTTFLFNIIMIRLLGSDGVAAIAILLYLDFVLIAISMGYSIGVAPLISYNYGADERAKLKKIYRLSLLLSFGVGIIMTAITVLFSPQLTSVFSKEGTMVFNLASGGLKIYALSYLFKGFNVYTSALFTAFGNGRISALLSCMRTLVFLIVSLLGLAALFGVTGVWWASVVAEFLALLLCAFYTFRYRKQYHYL